MYRQTMPNQNFGPKENDAISFFQSSDDVIEVVEDHEEVEAAEDAEEDVEIVQGQDEIETIVLKFVQDVSVEYLRQESSSSQSVPIENLRNLRNQLFAFTEQDLSSLEYGYRYMENMADSIVKYIELVLAVVHSEIVDERLQRKYLTRYLDLLPEVINNTTFKNIFTKNGTQKVLEIFIMDNFNVICKGCLLKTFNQTIMGVDKSLRCEVAQTLIDELYKLVDQLGNFGEYVIQCDIMETVFRIFGSVILSGQLKYKLIPDSEELSRSLQTEISYLNFDNDIRKWLYKFNEKSDKVFSLICSEVKFGSTISKMPKSSDSMWVDLNVQDKAVGWYCEVLEEDDWSYVTLPSSYVQRVHLKREKNNVTLTILCSKPCVSYNLAHQSYFDQLDKVITMKYENIVPLDRYNRFVNKVLPGVFPQHISRERTSSKTGLPAKKVYKPLDATSVQRYRPSSNASSLNSSSMSSIKPNKSVERKGLPATSPVSIASSCSSKTVVRLDGKVADGKRLCPSRVSTAATNFCLNTSPIKPCEKVSATRLCTSRASIFAPSCTLSGPSRRGSSSVIISISEDESEEIPVEQRKQKDEQDQINQKLQDNIVTSSIRQSEELDAQSFPELDTYHALQQSLQLETSLEFTKSLTKCASSSPVRVSRIIQSSELFESLAQNAEEVTKTERISRYVSSPTDLTKCSKKTGKENAGVPELKSNLDNKIQEKLGPNKAADFIDLSHSDDGDQFDTCIDKEEKTRSSKSVNDDGDQFDTCIDKEEKTKSSKSVSKKVLSFENIARSKEKTIDTDKNLEGLPKTPKKAKKDNTKECRDIDKTPLNESKKNREKFLSKKMEELLEGEKVIRAKTSLQISEDVSYSEKEENVPQPKPKVSRVSILDVTQENDSSNDDHIQKTKQKVPKTRGQKPKISNKENKTLKKTKSNKEKSKSYLENNASDLCISEERKGLSDNANTSLTLSLTKSKADLCEALHLKKVLKKSKSKERKVCEDSGTIKETTPHKKSKTSVEEKRATPTFKIKLVKKKPSKKTEVVKTENNTVVTSETTNVPAQTKIVFIEEKDTGNLESKNPSKTNLEDKMKKTCVVYLSKSNEEEIVPKEQNKDVLVRQKNHNIYKDKQQGISSPERKISNKKNEEDNIQSTCVVESDSKKAVKTDKPKLGEGENISFTENIDLNRNTDIDYKFKSSCVVVLSQSEAVKKLTVKYSKITSDEDQNISKDSHEKQTLDDNVKPACVVVELKPEKAGTVTEELSQDLFSSQPSSFSQNVIPIEKSLDTESAFKIPIVTEHQRWSLDDHTDNGTLHPSLQPTKEPIKEPSDEDLRTVEEDFFKKSQMAKESEKPTSKPSSQGISQTLRNLDLAVTNQVVACTKDGSDQTNYPLNTLDLFDVLDGNKPNESRKTDSPGLFDQLKPADIGSHSKESLDIFDDLKAETQKAIARFEHRKNTGKHVYNRSTDSSDEFLPSPVQNSSEVTDKEPSPTKRGANNRNSSDGVLPSPVQKSSEVTDKEPSSTKGGANNRNSSDGYLPSPVQKSSEVTDKEPSPTKRGTNNRNSSDGFLPSPVQKSSDVTDKEPSSTKGGANNRNSSDGFLPSPVQKSSEVTDTEPSSTKGGANNRNSSDGFLPSPVQKSSEVTDKEPSPTKVGANNRKETKADQVKAGQTSKPTKATIEATKESMFNKNIIVEHSQGTAENDKENKESSPHQDEQAKIESSENGKVSLQSEVKGPVKRRRIRQLFSEDLKLSDSDSDKNARQTPVRVARPLRKRKAICYVDELDATPKASSKLHKNNKATKDTNIPEIMHETFVATSKPKNMEGKSAAQHISKVPSGEHVLSPIIKGIVDVLVEESQKNISKENDILPISDNGDSNQPQKQTGTDTNLFRWDSDSSVDNVPHQQQIEVVVDVHDKPKRIEVPDLTNVNKKNEPVSMDLGKKYDVPSPKNQRMNEIKSIDENISKDAPKPTTLENNTSNHSFDHNSEDFDKPTDNNFQSKANTTTSSGLKKLYNAEKDNVSLLQRLEARIAEGGESESPMPFHDITATKAQTEPAARKPRAKRTADKSKKPKASPKPKKGNQTQQSKPRQRRPRKSKGIVPFNSFDPFESTEDALRYSIMESSKKKNLSFSKSFLNTTRFNDIKNNTYRTPWSSILNRNRPPSRHFDLVGRAEPSSPESSEDPFEKLLQQKTPESEAVHSSDIEIEQWNPEGFLPTASPVQQSKPLKKKYPGQKPESTQKKINILQNMVVVGPKEQQPCEGVKRYQQEVSDNNTHNHGEKQEQEMHVDIDFEGSPPKRPRLSDPDELHNLGEVFRLLARSGVEDCPPMPTDEQVIFYLCVKICDGSLSKREAKIIAGILRTYRQLVKVVSQRK